MSKKLVDEIVALLRDTDASIAERDDAAMDLGQFDSEKAERALFEIAINDSEDEELLASCGESLAEMWTRQAHFDRIKVNQLAAAAKSEAISYLEAKSSYRQSLDAK